MPALIPASCPQQAARGDVETVLQVEQGEGVVPLDQGPSKLVQEDVPCHPHPTGAPARRQSRMRVAAVASAFPALMVGCRSSTGR
jgi:hypothetical protein